MVARAILRGLAAGRALTGMLVAPVTGPAAVRRTLRILLAATLVPAALGTAAAPAAAAGNSLTVTLLNRAGGKVATTVSVVNLATNSIATVRTGKVRSLPRGRYAVLASVYDARNYSTTIGGKVVAVSGRTRVTIDARQGRPLKVGLTGASTAGHYQQLRASICASDSIRGGVDAYGDPGKVFVIPTGAKRLRFAYLSSWTSSDPSADAYVVVGAGAGVPGAPGRTFQRASLGTVTVTARRGPAGSPDTGISVQPRSGHSCRDSLQAGVLHDTTPFAVRTHLSPGPWEFTAAVSATDNEGGYPYIGHWYATRKVAGGKSYSQVFFRSAWGPARSLPTVLYKRLHFDTDAMFVDPGLAYASAWGSEASQKSVVTLKRGGKVLVRKTHTGWRVQKSSVQYLLKRPGWHTLTVDARRYRPGISYPKDMLSTRATATFRFRADPAVDAVAPVFLTRFIPAGLDMNNRARPGSTTAVALRLDRPKQDPDAKVTKTRPKTVTARASFDGGKTWRTVRVSGSGTSWTAHVPNPTSGAVSLRAKVTDAKGNSSEITVIRAYAIG